jgi:hypothetical protein
VCPDPIYVTESTHDDQEESHLEFKKPYEKPQIRFCPAGSPQFTVFMAAFRKEDKNSTDQEADSQKEMEESDV